MISATAIVTAVSNRVSNKDFLRMDNKFVDGLFAKAPRANAPEFVKGSVSVIKREEFMRWVAPNKTDEWINLDVKEGKSGKWYAQVNDWKPSGGGMPQMPTFTLPSRCNRYLHYVAAEDGLDSISRSKVNLEGPVDSGRPVAGSVLRSSSNVERQIV